MDIKEYYLSLGIDEKVYELCQSTEEVLSERFKEIDKNAELCQVKVLKAMQRSRLAEGHLYGTTGYGYNDSGRDTIEMIYADVFGTEDALVRQQITCGTHALTIALSAVLRPGDEMLSIAGPVYDTLQGVIGIRKEVGSLSEFGITYDEVSLMDEPIGETGLFDRDAIKGKLRPNTKLIEIQRSRGYDTRPSLSVNEIEGIIKFIKEIRPDIVIMVDNCYGEFVEPGEPSGADLLVGSLIKNPGGGLAPIGGYICGRKDLIELCAARLTSPGLGKEVGASLGVTRQIAQGLFLSPTVTASALKGAVFAAAVYEKMGFTASPSSDAKRTDIIQQIALGSEDGMKAFCEGIQAAAPVDSYVTPVPWDMPGYEEKVIMAAGAFISGASIELSADGPIRDPFVIYFQGGLTYPHAKFGIMMSLQKMQEKGLFGI